MNEKIKGKFLIYKGKPLIRENNTICYGNMSDKYVLLLTILTNKIVDKKELPDKIFIQVQSTNHENVIKQGEKNGLYDAIDIGLVWLDRALDE